MRLAFKDGGEARGPALHPSPRTPGAGEAVSEVGRRHLTSCPGVPDQTVAFTTLSKLGPSPGLQRPGGTMLLVRPGPVLSCPVLTSILLWPQKPFWASSPQPCLQQQ